MKILYSFVLLLFILAGCSQKEEIGYQTDDDRTQPYQISTKDNQVKETNRQSFQDISERLAATAKEMPNVSDATAVAVGRYAIVGIDVDDQLERSEVGSIKYTVAEALKNEPHGASAMVVADPDLYARLKELAQDFRNGQPIQGIANELADIAGRAMPEIPGNLTPVKEPEQAPDQSKKPLNQDQRQELNKEQEKQSNFYK
ncbi:YhcN/YlaJ family sporulation lipoprotein [Bacillus ectoiniformans]|nr:YhcN/YlaJ family sporulation lipoprotein [Bacillus ectoiniformans]MBM7647264.1 YhcN/YlaJ family sporulation lipoprotein [Bacillus ectoiniformans]